VVIEKPEEEDKQKEWRYITAMPALFFTPVDKRGKHLLQKRWYDKYVDETYWKMFRKSKNPSS
jgi:hypothetical protein